MNIQADILDNYFMAEALRLAEQAYEEGEIPVGAVVVIGERVIGKGYNQTERLNDVTAHAEMIAITAAADNLGSKYLTDCTLYVTLEPCVMCAGALYWTQMKRVVIGAKDEKRGFTKLGKPVLHPKTQLVNGILADESQQLLLKFFRQLRT
ncbi:tRNA-specific adenosine deaminase [Dyadobacter sp. CECT 9623]|uniref:tRNA-specific adenosine deaminase n=1 Tax=Dyadobacter linearis TaxID=2823330 RepID=A0ABM8UT79_9BACT|nr:nucleoside deaminase [Dyadobacter sp. CECT 9623]CAG5071520.1 tRNA-specific adenosine deaminase [Dyadobacter sp. CECT 9623]